MHRYALLRLFTARAVALSGVLTLGAACLGAQTLVMVSGNGQIVAPQFISNAPLVVQAKDASGHPAAGVAVAWAITDGLGTVSNPQNTTDNNGLASAKFLSDNLQPLESYRPSTITATSSGGTVTFVVTTIQSISGNSGVSIQFTPDVGTTYTAKSGSTLPGAVTIHVTATAGFLAGTAIPNVGLRVGNNQDLTATPPAACNGQNGLVLTDANGAATCDLVVTGAPSQTQLVGIVGEFSFNPVFNLTITPGTSCTYSLSAASQNFGSSGGTGSVNVLAAAGCGWTAASNAAFVSITAGATGTGNGTVSYSVAANTGAARSGTLSIAGQTYTVNQGVAAGPGLAIATQNLPVGTINVPYSTTLSATGGQQPYTWSNTGSLPAHVALVPSTGVLSGTPGNSGSFGFTATVRDSAGATQSQTFTLIINGASTGGFTITNTSFANGVVGQPYSQLLTTSGGSFSPFAQHASFSIAAGALPAGLGITNNTDGSHSIAGTPQNSGSSSFTLSARDLAQNVANASFTIIVGGPPGSQQMTVSPTSLSFTVQLGAAGSPNDQTIAISSSSGTLAYTGLASTNGGGNWLVVKTTASGTTPSNIGIGVANFANLAPGPYSGSISITSSAGNSPVVVPVTMTVLAVPVLTVVSPTAFTVNQVATSSPNLTPVSQQSIVLSSGSVPVHFTATASTTDGGRWLIVLPAQGNTPATLAASVNSGGMAPGTYTGSVTITPASGPLLTVSFTLVVTPAIPALTAVTNAASFGAGPVAPGEIVTLFGSALGPLGTVTFHITEFGRLDTTLAGTQVYFDGFQAPLVYTGAGQVSAIVPYEIAGNATTSVFVQYLNVRSNAIPVPVVDALPAIFTIDSSGSGQGAILNQDTSVNSIQNGADPGSVVSIFATGEGQTDPSGVDGIITGSVLRKPLLPVTVLIDNQIADVTYAGAAPGEPAGVLQVNARVPASVKRGTSVSVVIKVGTAPSRDGVTLAIKP